MENTHIIDEIAEKARKDYESLLDKVILVDRVDAYFGDVFHPDLALDPPALMRVTPYLTDESRISHIEQRWMDDVLDPVYDLELVVPHPKLEGATSLYCWGQSYGRDGSSMDGMNFVLAPDEIQQEHGPKVDTSSPWYRP